jgi:hypothetical protein
LKAKIHKGFWFEKQKCKTGDYNKIKTMFRKLKSLLRVANDSQARSTEGLAEQDNLAAAV